MALFGLLHTIVTNGQPPCNHLPYIVEMKQLFLLACTVILLLACKRETMDDRICKQTREHTEKSCPKRMDAYTVLDSMVYHPTERMMTYHYSVSDKMDVDSIYTTGMKDLFDASLLNNIRHNAGLNELKQHAVTFSYIYSSQTRGRVYMTFTYTPDDYASQTK